MSKFTQGEWKVIQGVGLDELDVISEDKKDICCLFSYPISRWGEQKANAHLIAAAPKMYELLKVWVNAISQPVSFRVQMVNEARDQARELLARINGEVADNGE